MKRSAPWIVLAILAAGILAVRLQVSFDISAFFPQQTNLAHEILLEQFRNGPGSRILVIGLNGPDAEQLADLSDQLRGELAESQLFSSVVNGEFAGDVSAPPEPVASYYPLMRDIDYSKAALESAVNARLQDMAFGGGAAMLQLFARDPYLVTLDVLDRLAPASMSGEMWFAEDGSAVLLAETHAGAVDLEGQARAVAFVNEVFAELSADPAIALELTGAGAFGVELQETIRAEAQKRSIMASIALVLVLLFFFRRPRYLILAGLPIGMGMLLGLAAVSLLFENVHGITLAFGFTLMGVAIDYPLHLFSHAGSSSGISAIQRIWPTMRLGALSTAIAYLALAFSGSDGLAQLGVFTAVGVLVAVLVTKTWVPEFLGSQEAASAGSADASAATLRVWPAALLLILAIVGTNTLSTDSIWDDRLTSLSPVPAERIARDNALRAAASTPDMRYQIVLHDESLQNLLVRTERLDERLTAAVADGVLDGWQSVTQLVGSEATQERRRDAIPDDSVLRERLAEVLANTPFRADAFDEFAVTVGVAAESTNLSAEDFRDTPLSSWLESRLVQVGQQWVALVSVSGVDNDELSARVAGWDDNVSLVDISATSVSLMQDYRNGAITTVSLAAILVLGLLAYQRRQFLQVAWVSLTVLAVLAATISLVVLIHGQLTVIHLVALLLVMGLGLDYALFVSRTEGADEREATDKAVLACAASTVIAFGLLAGSSIPVLKFIGLTVAVGSALSLAIAFAGGRLRRVS